MTPEVLLDYRPLWAVLISLAAAALILITGEKRPNLRESWTILAALGKVAIVFSMLPVVLSGQVLEIACQGNFSAIKSRYSRYAFCRIGFCLMGYNLFLLNRLYAWSS